MEFIRIALPASHRDSMVPRANTRYTSRTAARRCGDRFRGVEFES
jgi:hypothetical protein